MDLASFKFPQDLKITDSGLKSVLIVGACTAEHYAKLIPPLAPGVHFDYVMFNNAMPLPATTPRACSEYDFQFIALPLRDIVTDKIIDFRCFNESELNKSLIEHAVNNLHIMFSTAMRYNDEHGILSFVSNFTTPSVRVTSALDRRGSQFDFTSLVELLNRELAQLISSRKNAYLFDTESISGSLGKRYFHDDLIGFYPHSGFWYPAIWDLDHLEQFHAPVPGRIEPMPRLEEFYGSHIDQVWQAIWAHMEWLYRAVRGIDSVKLVIFDLDNTMWRGEIAEHYDAGANWPRIDGWPLGVWEAVQHLRARGILLAICSKNHEDVVRERWERAVAFNWVSISDFDFVSINWQPKAQNIAQIIEAASLTPKSVVFVDDNPVERESVSAAIPGIRTIGSNPNATRRILLWSAETQVATLSDETWRRSDMIRSAQRREQERASLSREAFLFGLNARVRLDMVQSPSDADYPRAFELLNKTNQFNTTGRRWTAAEMKQFLDAGGRLYVFRVEDKFTQYGLVGVILYHDRSFRQFAMSCRILGLDVEASVVNLIMRSESGDGDVRPFVATVVETEANRVCRDIYVRCGFGQEETGGRFVRTVPVPDETAPHLVLDVPATPGLFDEAGYLAANRDLQKAQETIAGFSARDHFHAFGRFENRRMVIGARPEAVAEELVPA